MAEFCNIVLYLRFFVFSFAGLLGIYSSVNCNGRVGVWGAVHKREGFVFCRPPGVLVQVVFRPELF